MTKIELRCSRDLSLRLVATAPETATIGSFGIRAISWFAIRVSHGVKARLTPVSSC